MSEITSASDESPFEVPPFSPPQKPAKYIWWSWHPNYPYWSQSCWEFATIEEAMKFVETHLTVYHNKLIRHDGITLTEVQDVPCREMDIWRKIKQQQMQEKEKPI